MLYALLFFAALASACFPWALGDVVYRPRRRPAQPLLGATDAARDPGPDHPSHGSE